MLKQETFYEVQSWGCVSALLGLPAELNPHLLCRPPDYLNIIPYPGGVVNRFLQKSCRQGNPGFCRGRQGSAPVPGAAGTVPRRLCRRRQGQAGTALLWYPGKAGGGAAAAGAQHGAAGQKNMPRTAYTVRGTLDDWSPHQRWFNAIRQSSQTKQKQQRSSRCR